MHPDAVNAWPKVASNLRPSCHGCPGQEVIEDYLSLRLRLSESMAHDRLVKAEGRATGTGTGLVSTRQRPGTTNIVI